MERAFTEDIGRFKRGDIRNYPPPTWKGIVKNVGKPLESFSKAIEDVIKESTMSLPEKKKQISRITRRKK